MKSRLYDKIRLLLASDRFFYAVIVLLVVQAAWIALSGRFPMAYDEQNHLGVIKLYADHILPFWSQQPDGPAPFSAVSRDPSYLYHWLMSFPYRLFDVFLRSDDSKVLAFRFISIGLFAAGMVLYRKLLLRTRSSKAIINTVLAIFVLTPTVPFLAGQMNYDNLLFLLVAGILLLTAKIIDDIKAGRFDSRRLAAFAGLGMLAGLVKFPFLAILLPLTIWIFVVYFRRYGTPGWRKGARLSRQSFTGLSKPLRAAVVLMVLIPGGLFFERYGLNTIRYSTPVPECDQVLDVERCMAFGPWRRNYNIYQSKLNGTLQPAKTDIYHFTYDEWLKLLTWQFFYTLNGPVDNFSVGRPLPLPYFLGLAIVSVGAVLTVAFRRYIFRRPLMKGLIFVAVFYVFVLWAQNYSDFLRLHLATAIQARYIVIVLPILYLALALAYARALRSVRPVQAVLVIGVVSVFLTQGGGIGVFVMRSNELWWWQSGRVVRANETAQRILRPIVIGEHIQPVPKKSYPD